MEAEVILRDEMVAKKKQSEPERERRDEQLHVMCTARWKGWVERFASKDVRSVSDQIWLAMSELAKKEGFEEPPER